MQRYHLHVCMNGSVFLKDGRQRKMMRDPPVHPPRTLPRTLSKSKNFCNIIVYYRPNVFRGARQPATKFCVRNLARQNWMPQQNKDLSAISADFLDTASKYDNFSYFTIAGDETCSPQYDMQTKIQSAEWRRTNSPASRKFRAEPSKTFFFSQQQICSAQGISFRESDCKPRCLHRNTATFTRRHSTSSPALWATGKWFLLHNNAQPHTALSAKEF